VLAIAVPFGVRTAKVFAETWCCLRWSICGVPGCAPTSPWPVARTGGAGRRRGRGRARLAVVRAADARRWPGGPPLSRWSAAWSRGGPPGFRRQVWGPRGRVTCQRLMADLWPPALPAGGVGRCCRRSSTRWRWRRRRWRVAVLVTVVSGPWATRWRSTSADGSTARSVLRMLLCWVATSCLLVLRSVPPTAWAVLALLVLFSGVLPGALALGLYSARLLGRLVTEAWENLDPRPLAPDTPQDTGASLADLRRSHRAPVGAPPHPPAPCAAAKSASATLPWPAWPATRARDACSPRTSTSAGSPVVTTLFRASFRGHCPDRDGRQPTP
jgi:hypothetical protein